MTTTGGYCDDSGWGNAVLKVSVALACVRFVDEVSVECVSTFQCAGRQPTSIYPNYSRCVNR